VASNPGEFIAALPWLDRAKARVDLTGSLDAARGKFPQVVNWSLIDIRRITPVPAGHWLLLHDSRCFRVTLRSRGQQRYREAIEVDDGYVVCFPPQAPASPEAVDAALEMERNGVTTERVQATVRFLAAAPVFNAVFTQPPPTSLVLLTNGRGGMARLDVDLGGISSKYDCALGANLSPDYPVDRHVLAKRVRAWVSADGFVTPLNLQNLVSFQTGPPAVWNFVAEAGDGRTVEIRLTADMVEEWNTSYFSFVRLPGTKPLDLPPKYEVQLIVRVDIEDRNFHVETHRNGGADYHFSQHCHTLEDQSGFAFTPAADRQLRVFSNDGIYHPQPEWSQGIPHPVELTRGQPSSGDAYSPGWFDLPLKHGKNASLILSADIPAPSISMIEQSAAHRQGTAKSALARALLPEDDAFGRQLTLASRAFVVRRGTGCSVIAGYPWFLDWGRDSFISARGMLAAGLGHETADLLVTFGRFAENGLMPNTIHGDDASNRDTSDAPLWYGVVCEETAATFDETIYDRPVDASGRKIVDVLREIAAGYTRGTANGIRMDAASGLIWSPSHFTWMDTNYPACTPREGYPVEIQALWIRLLLQLQRLDAQPVVEPWGAMADQALESLKKLFWLEEPGYLADLLIARPGQPAATATADNALRNNQLLAIAFGFITGAEAQGAVAAALRYLFVPGALRTLAPLPVWPPLELRRADGQLLGEPREPYRGRYEGDEDTQRKPAYHNGTAWTWTLPMACEALVKAWDTSPAAIAAAKSYLGGMDYLLKKGCLGQLPEILDGDAPHQPRGCDAQAWSVFEALRVWKWLNSL
jgi:glycogen debranching enzyme